MADKTPKWLVEWNQLVGDHKFLEIKGWYQWQEKNYTTDYIRDYYGKDEDPDYYTKSCLHRWMMDWLRRQRGRLRHTLPNNPRALISRMNINSRAEAAQAPSNLLAMVEQGFLIPTNEQVRDQKWTKETKVKETNDSSLAELSGAAVPAEQASGEDKSNPAEGDPQTPPVEDRDIELLNLDQNSVQYEALSDSDKEIRGLCFKLSEYSGVPVKPTWVPFAREIVAAHGAHLCWQVLDWIFRIQIEDKKFRWADRTKNMKNFRDHMMKGTVIAQYNAFVDKWERDTGQKAVRAHKPDSGGSEAEERCRKNPDGGLNHDFRRGVCIHCGHVESETPEEPVTVSKAFEIEDEP